MKSAHALDDIDGTFRDRAHAGRFLVDMGVLSHESNPHLIAFAPGGLSIAREMSRANGVSYDFAVVADMSPPWLGGPIFGAVAFDGSVVVDDELKEVCSVTREEFHRLVEGAYEQVARLVEERRGEPEFPDLKGRTAVVVDDGLSASFATRAAMVAVRNSGASRVVLALPMGYRRSVQRLSAAADLTYCASLRSAGGELSTAYAPMHHLSCLASKQRKARHLGRAGVEL